MIPSPRRTAVRTGLAAGLLAVAVALAGCTPSPDPTPTPTPLFTSEADAFKAAEQVYREYVDATNASNDGNENADPLKYLAGSALEDAIAGVRKRESSGTTVKGHVALVAFRSLGAKVGPAGASVEASVCIDVAESWLSDRFGNNVTPTARAPRANLSVGFAQSHGGLLISRSELAGQQC